MVTIQEKGRIAITFLSNKKRNLILHEPPLVKDNTNIKQIIEHPLGLNYPNHTQHTGSEADNCSKWTSGRAKSMGWEKIIMLPERLQTNQCSNGNIGITL